MPRVAPGAFAFLREVAQAPATKHAAPRRPRLRLISRLPAPRTSQRASCRYSCLAVRTRVRSSRSRRKRSVLATSSSMWDGMLRPDMSITGLRNCGDGHRETCNPRAERCECCQLLCRRRRLQVAPKGKRLPARTRQPWRTLSSDACGANARPLARVRSAVRHPHVTLPLRWGISGVRCVSPTRSRIH
jgi:hypothetical protein